MDKLENETKVENLIKEFNEFMLKLQPNEEKAGA